MPLQGESCRQIWTLPWFTHIPNVYPSDANHFGPLPDLGDLLRGSLGLRNIAADNASVGAEMDQGSSLRTADRAGASGDKDDSVSCIEKSTWLVVAPKRAKRRDRPMGEAHRRCRQPRPCSDIRIVEQPWSPESAWSVPIQPQ